jgi:hypothetical protein
MIAYFNPDWASQFMPQLIALSAFAGTALLAVLLWPFTTFMRIFRSRKQQPAAALTPADEEAP